MRVKVLHNTYVKLKYNKIHNLILINKVIRLVIIVTIWNANTHIYVYIYRVSQEERTKLREGVPYVIYRYNPKHLYPKLNGYRDNGKRSLKL